MRCILLLFFTLLGSFFATSQELSEQEEILYNLIMEYRKEQGLPVIPLSSSLTFVAQTHVQDLIVNKPDVGPCNAHSWSSEGDWTPCCYTPDHVKANCLWSKPSELTSYSGNGYEIACGSNKGSGTFVMTPAYALQSWKNSAGHNNVIINQSTWKKMQWNAIGIGLSEGFAVVWFGEELDE